MKRTILRRCCTWWLVRITSRQLVEAKKDDSAASENELTVYVDNGYKAHGEASFERSGTK